MASKRKSHIFNHEELEAEIKRENSNKLKQLNFKQSAHSLDSDEEDEKEIAGKYNVLDPNDLEGEEDGTIDFDGEIKITPFNMKEELEEGYFDKEGTYIFNKESQVVKDQWLDDIDWIKIKAREGTNMKELEEDDDDDSQDSKPEINLAEKYMQMLEIMKPSESVQKAICRLGGSNSSRSASNRWKKKKNSESDETNKNNEVDFEKLQLLTSLADEVLASGDMDIYQQTYEKLSFYVKSNSEKLRLKDSANADPALDMFGDDFEETVDESKVSMPPPRVPSPTVETVDLKSEVMWEFKWEASDDAKLYGPYPSSQMQNWVEDKYFENGVFIREVGKPDAQFYSSKRIDFELYF